MRVLLVEDDTGLGAAVRDHVAVEMALACRTFGIVRENAGVRATGATRLQPDRA